MIKILLRLCLTLLIPQFSYAIIEVGASMSYRQSTLSENNFQKSISGTSSISYYIGSQSAIELNYTQGTAIQKYKISTEPATTIRSEFQMYGADVVFSFTDRSASVQPYIKVGGAHIHKENFRSIEGFGTDKIATVEGWVPSAGLGFKIRLTDRFFLKGGADIWWSPTTTVTGEKAKTTTDFAVRAGFSWYL